MTCRYCYRPIYFTGVLYRLSLNGSSTCPDSPNFLHAH